jgi:nucleoside-diphosphate-sugar epimerase
MKITLIGASGFVGTRLIEEIGLENCLNLDKNPSYFYPECTKTVDIRSGILNHHFPQNTEVVVLLAAEHRDDVSPVSLYYEVNVEGTKNVLKAMDEKGIKNIIFTSSVAVYGLNKQNPEEKHPVDPFNHYGKSKWQAEEVLRKWYQKDSDNRSLTIIRPTVIFGERNRGNVYNLLKQIASGKFLMIGKGTNKKSMAYVGNVVAFIKYCMERQAPGYRLYNYTDQPDNSMNELVNEVENALQKKIPTLRIPYSIGYTGAMFFDILARLTNKKFPISAIRVKKFCATTQFNSAAAHSSGFKPPYTLKQALHQTLHYEFLNSNKDNQVFYSE